jgi:hypothetical protein
VTIKFGAENVRAPIHAAFVTPTLHAARMYSRARQR